MTLNELFTALSGIPADTPLVISTPDGPVRGGYHLTEFKHAHIRGLSCAGKTEDWDELTIQLLDGFGGDHMTVGKAMKIVSLALAEMPEAADYPLFMEYGTRNASRALFSVEAPVLKGGEATLALRHTHVGCKAMTGFQNATLRAVTRCC